VNCPYCSPAEQKGSRVIETRGQNGDAVLRRRRECLAEARHRFTTYEGVLPEASDPQGPPSDQPLRRRLPSERQSITHKFSIAGHEGYITAGMFEDGALGEIFLTDFGKEGSTMRGMMNAFATAFSVALQYGVPLETLARKFSHMRFEPEGLTGNPEIPFARSMPDYIARWLASRFLDPETCEELGVLTPEVRARHRASAGRSKKKEERTSAHLAVITVECPQCGADMRQTGTSHTCPSCGYSTAPE
jgi:hypothetical protein